MVIRTALMGLILSVSALAQDGSVVNLSQGSAPLGYQSVLGYKTISITSITKANPAVLTASAAHGYAVGSTFTGFISGATGTGWTAINAYWTATVASTTTFSIATDSTGFGTLGGTVVFNTSQLAYTCKGQSDSTARLSRTPIAISAMTVANPTVATSTAHGLALNSRPQVTVSGATGAGWSAVNIATTATVVDANTFSIPVDTSALGAVGGSPVFVTSAPRLGITEWAVQKFAYDLGQNLIGVFWLNASSRYASLCSNGTSTSVNQQ